MSPLSLEILELLQHDLVSHGWVAQGAAGHVREPSEVSHCVTSILEELLESDAVDIGDARARLDYVEFTAWRGTVSDRVRRAAEAVVTAKPRDQEFAYWLCLRKNVDRFEGLQ